MIYTDDFLESLRLEADPLADQVVKEIEGTGQVDQVNKLLRHLTDNMQSVSEELPVHVQEYLQATSHPPEWADRTRLERAAEFGALHGISITLILCTSSLVQCYSAKKGVKVLAFTHSLEEFTHRRVLESGQFVLSLLSREAFFEQGHAIPALQKVRLMHAAVRYFINKSGRWQTNELGLPICQEDLLGSLMAFSVSVLRGLARLGFEVTPEQAEDFYYLWRVAGEMLGIRPDIIPATFAEAETVADMIERRHSGPSPEGVQLTLALLQMHQHLLPEKLFEGALASMIRLMVGDQIANWMQVPHTRWESVTNHVPVLGHLLHNVEPRSALIRHALGLASRAFLATDAFVMSGLRRTRFEIPSDLRSAWGMED